jgi:hypothetical protein
MGRPEKPESMKREVVVRVTLTTHEKARLDAVGNRVGLDAATLCRVWVLQKLNEGNGSI